MSSLEARNFVRRNGGLFPADRFADEFLSEIPANREVLVTVRRPRNPRQHSLLFALLRKVVENTDRWPSEEALLDDLKLATGHVEKRINLVTGEPYIRPRSISYASLDQVRFNRWFKRAVFVLATEVLRVAPQELADEVMAMVERSRA